MTREQLFDVVTYSVKHINWQNFILYSKSVNFIVCFSLSFFKLEYFFGGVLHNRPAETYVLLSFWELNLPWCLFHRITSSPKDKVRLVPLYRPQKSNSFNESLVANGSFTILISSLKIFNYFLRLPYFTKSKFAETEHFRVESKKETISYYNL